MKVTIEIDGIHTVGDLIDQIAQLPVSLKDAEVWIDGLIGRMVISFRPESICDTQCADHIVKKGEDYPVDLLIETHSHE